MGLGRSTTGNEPGPGQDPWVDHPLHYNKHPSGVETIDLIEHLNLCVGTSVKYAMRHLDKGVPVQDIEKCVWYLQREERRLREGGTPSTRAPEDIWEAVITAEPSPAVRTYYRMVRSGQLTTAIEVMLELRRSLLAGTAEAGRIDQ